MSSRVGVCTERRAMHARRRAVGGRYGDARRGRTQDGDAPAPVRARKVCRTAGGAQAGVGAPGPLVANGKGLT